MEIQALVRLVRKRSKNVRNKQTNKSLITVSDNEHLPICVNHKCLNVQCLRSLQTKQKCCPFDDNVNDMIIS